MTDKILKFMDEKRKVQNKKENWLREKCDKIEDLAKKDDSFNLYKEIKTVAGTYRKRITSGNRKQEWKNLHR